MALRQQIEQDLRHRGSAIMQSLSLFDSPDALENSPQQDTQAASSWTVWLITSCMGISNPELRCPSDRFPYRTSWVCVHCKWECAEREMEWMELEDRHQFTPQRPVAGLVTIFHKRTRREQCLDDGPTSIKRRRRDPAFQQVNATQQPTQSKTKLKCMLEKEIPYARVV